MNRVKGRCDCDPRPIRKSIHSEDVEYVHQSGCPTGLGSYGLRLALRFSAQVFEMARNVVYVDE